MQNSSCRSSGSDAAERIGTPPATVRARRAAGRGAPRPAPREKRSCPAGTGVCVVKTTCEATRRIASSAPIPSVVHPPPHQLERGERAVPLVQMHDAGRDAERRERADAADAEQQLLADADALIAAVQPRRQLAVLGAVAVHVGVEQQERVAADRDPPDAGDDPSGPRLDLDGDRHAVARGRLHRQLPMIDVDVLLALPAVAVEPLPEVALVVVQADADERDAEVGRALEMVAGQDAEAAGVDRHRLVQAELGREVRDRPGAQSTLAWRAPHVCLDAGTPAAAGRPG